MHTCKLLVKFPSLNNKSLNNKNKHTHTHTELSLTLQSYDLVFYNASPVISYYYDPPRDHMEPSSQHQLKNFFKIKNIQSERAGQLLHTFLFAPRMTPVQTLVHQNHFSLICKSLPHVETDAGGMDEVICYILPVLCLQTLHHLLFTLNSASTWNLVPHLKLGSQEQNTVGKFVNPTSSRMMSCFP